jgi:Predicted dehydrogenases and related proteins
MLPPAFRPLPEVRWGILGCGDVTEVKSGPALQKCTGSRLVAVMRRDAAKAADYARRHGVPRHYSDAAALCADPEVNAIYIATPPGSHLELARLAAASGKPAYVEKPYGRSAVEAAAINAAFADAGLPVFAAYYRRALPRFVKVRELLASGAIGRVAGVVLRLAAPPPRDNWRLDPAVSGGGLFYDHGSHTLDLLDLFVGPLRDVSGHAANRSGLHPAVEDTVALTFLTADGAPGAAHWNFAAPHREDCIEIHGGTGRILFSVFSEEPVRLQRTSATAGLTEEVFDIPHPPHVQQPLIQTVVDTLRGLPGATCPSTGDSALRTSLVMDTALDRFYGGRADAFWLRARATLASA